MSQSYKIMIVEDEELMSDKMEMQIEKLGHEVFAVVDNSDDALKHLEDQQPDLILMDVRIEGEYDGVELADMILKKWDIPVLFITSNHDDSTFRRISRIASEGMITKPFTDIQLQRSIGFILGKKKKEVLPENGNAISWAKDANELFIKHNKVLNRIHLDDIFYIESDGKYIQIHLVDRKFLVRMSLKEFHLKLDQKQFIQTHRKFVVNSKKINSIDLEHSVVMMDNMQVPLSRREREVVLKELDWL